jgi:LAO/AO transport system kinase
LHFDILDTLVFGEYSFITVGISTRLGNMISAVIKKGSRGKKKRGRSPIPPELWAGFIRGSRLACARMITAVEDHPELIPQIRHQLIPRLGTAVRVGITGPPGVGKSTITACLGRRAVEAGHSLGIIAVDPSSPFTGGAFLGDRVRMQGLDHDSKVFIRSQASREGHGGLSPSTPHVADILDAFGMDRILIETVGVGQAELDVLTCVDVIVLVLQPGTGDVIQSLKAGILEAADIIVVNKADTPGTDTLLESLRFTFDISARRAARPAPAILTASAIRDQGLDEVYTQLENRIRELVQSGQYHQKKRSLLEREITASIRDHLWDQFSALARIDDEIPNVVERIARKRQSPYPYIRKVCSQVKIQYKKERVGRGQSK